MPAPVLTVTVRVAPEPLMPVTDAPLIPPVAVTVRSAASTPVTGLVKVSVNRALGPTVGFESARFTLLTAKGQTALERGVTVIRDELAKIGLTVDTVPLDGNALVGTFLGGKPYDAVYFGLIPSDTDPAIILDFWLSNGGSHLWNPEQASPATAWERQIDQLMAQQAAARDMGARRARLNQVPKKLAPHEPLRYFAAPRVYVATSARVQNVEPMLRRPQALWSPDTIAVRR